MSFNFFSVGCQAALTSWNTSNFQNCPVLTQALNPNSNSPFSVIGQSSLSFSDLSPINVSTLTTFCSQGCVTSLSQLTPLFRTGACDNENLIVSSQDVASILSVEQAVFCSKDSSNGFCLIDQIAQINATFNGNQAAGASFTSPYSAATVCSSCVQTELANAYAASTSTLTLQAINGYNSTFYSICPTGANSTTPSTNSGSASGSAAPTAAHSGDLASTSSMMSLTLIFLAALL